MEMSDGVSALLAVYSLKNLAIEDLVIGKLDIIATGKFISSPIKPNF